MTGILIHKQDLRAFLRQRAKNSASTKICKIKIRLQSKPYLVFSDPIVVIKV